MSVSRNVIVPCGNAATGGDFYVDTYFEAFAKDQLPVVEPRLGEAITTAASLIIGAWEQAGRPAVPVERAKPLRPVPRPRS